MLTAIRLGNFKAFADTQRIPIRPLTLIFGANSSGKSSIIHSFLLAHHAIDKGILDVHRTEVGGDAVDLGGFRQYVHRRDSNRRVEWAVELDVAYLKRRLVELLAPVHRVAVSVTIGIQLDNEGNPVQGAAPEVQSYEIEADGSSVLKMSRRRDGTMRMDRLSHDHPVFREVLRAIVETSTTTPSLLPSDFEGLSGAVEAIVPGLDARVQRFLPSGLSRVEKKSSTMDQPTLFPVSRGRREEDLADALRFFLPRTVNDMMSGLFEAISKELSRVSYLGPLRSYPPRHLAFSQHHDPNWHAGGGYTWDIVRKDSHIRSMVNEWLGSPNRLQTPYELVIRELVGTDQLERLYFDRIGELAEEQLTADDESESDEAPDGIWTIIRDPETEAKRFREKISHSDIDRLNELTLIDRRFNTRVSHRDIGLGVSQVLPVLVSAYAHSNKIIAIEQPEIHLHPALQADLGDVFIESALGDRRNTFVLESHSEHLLLRIMRRMRETAKREKKIQFDVTPADVMVLFVERVNGKTLVREMPLNEYGELVKAWPGGFFEEGFKEVFAD